MKKLLKPLFFVCISACSMLFNVSAYAEQALSKPLIEQYVKTTAQLDELLIAHPDVEQQLSEAMMMDKSQRSALIRSMAIYPKVDDIISGQGFDSVEVFLDFSERVSAATINVEMKQTQNEMSLDDYIKQMKEQIAVMKKQGSSQALINEMEATINMQMNSMQYLLDIAKNSSEEDIKFATDNYEWLMQMLESTDEDSF
ncbi:hypothetical protein EKO29_09050 [Colwellia sp. Arc7-635]|uniref:hypothetical protein n=1 Tax=Colwellia sp. Arc7-635 TaxID=2497879 RepID=UPI000F84EBF7|nr:hypothetical protein [Colwellia sp. Arc7-635]AZQ84155.1 hypothetical protein EKO29_09050 [Colwellia sp. Arc7-635]